MKIEPTTTIEDIVKADTRFIAYLSEKGIRCIRCGEPIWGTLEEAAKAKGFNQEQIETFIRDMNGMID